MSGAFVWNDLPNFGRFHFAVRRWLSPRKWGAGAKVYWRDEALPIYVSAEQHEKLKEWLTDCAKISAATLEFYSGQWPDAFPEVDGKRTVPREFVLRWMSRIEKSNKDRGHKLGDFMWNMRERAAVYAVSTLRTRIVSGSSPRLPFVGDLPPGLSMRIAVGAQYGTRLDLLGEGWVGVGDLGRVWIRPEHLLPLTVPEKLAKVLYCEVSYFDQTWHLRPVYGDVLDAEEVERRRKAAKKKEAAS